MYPIIFVEIVVILSLLFRTPLRKYVMKGLGKSPVVTQTLSATLFVLFISSLYALFDLYKHFTDEAAINPSEQALMFHHLIEAAFLGICLFFVLIIDRLHYYMSESNRWKKQAQEWEFHAHKASQDQAMLMLANKQDFTSSHEQDQDNF
ncbi:unnamed protein product [Amaranthus hypochondriacus]